MKPHGATTKKKGVRDPHFSAGTAVRCNRLLRPLKCSTQDLHNHEHSFILTAVVWALGEAGVSELWFIFSLLK